MNVLPVAVLWSESATPTPEYLNGLGLLARNAGLVLERTAGILVDVDAPTITRSLEPRPALMDASGLPMAAWDAALRALRANGIDPSTRPVLATLDGGGLAGLGLRFGGPSGGALAAVGSATVQYALTIGPTPWTTAQRDVYAMGVWIAVHELGHALAGLPHNPPDSPNAPEQARVSFMNYGSLRYWRGVNVGPGTYDYMHTVGWTDPELAALRASSHARLSLAEYVRIFPFDREVVGRGRPDAPAWQVITTGFMIQEYPRLSGTPG